ncbi:MAG: 4-hydroxythreonine-4-phosphate dehydrogenase PdxA, partial [Niameybacter sp.]
RFEAGQVNGMCGKAAFEYIEKSIEWAMAKKVDAIATTPINKESCKAGKVPYIGHTEVLEDLTKTYNPLTMFQVKNLRVFFLSRHVSLKKACDLVTEENMYEFIIRSKEALKELGIDNPTIAIAGLNPHCGEHGLFGDEERQIEPAVERARQEGINVVGPIGADSVFFFGLQGKFDAVLSLYHDQGHIATKTVDFHRTISLTNNMPFLRTSVDHGTAFDIAWKNIADSVSLEEAIRLAAEYAPNFNKQ